MKCSLGEKSNQLEDTWHLDGLELSAFLSNVLFIFHVCIGMYIGIYFFHYYSSYFNLFHSVTLYSALHSSNSRNVPLHD